jgi:hypothetical protein
MQKAIDTANQVDAWDKADYQFLDWNCQDYAEHVTDLYDLYNRKN